MMPTIMFAVWGVLSASVLLPNATTTEEVGFSALLSHSHTHMTIQAVGAEAQATRCSDGDLLDWAAYQYQTPDGYDGYSPADRWRCVRKTDPDTAYKAKHYSPPRMKPPLPAVAQTGFYSNLDAETYKLFKKQIGTSGPNGFAWKVSDKVVLTFSASANRPGSFKPDNPEDDRPTWSVRFNEYRLRGKNERTSFQENDHALYAEPKVRLFHQGARYDLFIVSSKDFTGANKHFLWHIDKEKGTAYWEEKKDALTLDKFERSEYILDKGVLWRIHESRLIRGQRNRIFTYKTYENGSFEAWRQGTPGPQPPPTTFPPAPTE